MTSDLIFNIQIFFDTFFAINEPVKLLLCVHTLAYQNLISSIK